MTVTKSAKSPASIKLTDDTAAKVRRQNSRRKAHHSAEALRALAPTRNDLLPKLVLVDKSPANLKFSGRDLRPPSPAHVAEVQTSIQMFGMCVPVLVAGDEVIDGWVRVEAARSLRLAAVPCVEVGHLGEPEIRQLRLAVNRLGEKGTWDVEELRFEFQELQLLDAPIELLGFDTPELDLIMASEEEPPPEPEEALEPSDGPTVSRLGDLWLLNENRVLCADARDPESYARLMDGEKAQLIATDPPYNCPVAGHITSSGKHREFVTASGEMTAEEFQAFLDVVFGAAAAVLRAGGLLAAFMDWRQVAKVFAAGERAGLELVNLVVWAKTQAAMGSLWRSQHELLPVFKKPGAPHVNNVELGKHGRHRSNVWSYPGANTIGSEAREHLKDHPTPKPVAMLADAILDVTKLGDLVLDPFLGSGSTLMAAEQTGRRARGLELDPGYVDVILRRWMAAGGTEPLLAATGQTFSEVGREREREVNGSEAEAPVSAARD